MTDTTQEIKSGLDWADYVEHMKDKNCEEFLTGDIEGYRRGYTDGAKSGEQKAIDLTLAGAFVIALLAGAIGFAIGVGAFALP